MDESITLSLQEFITSGCLSESTFLFDHEVGVSEISGSFKHKSSKDQLHHLNAAKVSLLLAKEFCDRYSTGFINKTHENSLTSLHSSDIFVQVKCCSELDDVRCRPESEQAHAPDGGKEPTRLLAQAVDQAQRVPAPSAGHDHEDQGKKPYHHSPSSSASSFDVALEEIFSEDDDETNHDVRQKTDGTVSVADTDKNCCTVGRIRIPISDVVQFHTIDRVDMHKVYCTLIGVGIRCDPLLDSGPSPPPTEVSISAGIKILGNLIHTVFSQGEKTPLSSINQNSITPEVYDVDDAGIDSDTCIQRHSKQRRNKDESVFSCLGESGHYPISICRLVSDMVDVGPSSNADVPFASFDEVIHDLEHMSLFPEIFLHDPDNSFSSPSLLFGQRYYGRAAEVTKILELSTHLEQSTKLGCDTSVVETVFISGIAGCGKTHLARRVGNFLSSLGWIVLEAKFDRCTEYQSREVICSVLENLMSKLVDMKHGSNKNDTEYSQRAAEAISDTFDTASLSALADFIPSIHNFFDDIDTKESQCGWADTSHWQLFILFSKLLGAILRLDRFIMICLDDLQWCDSMMLTFVNEIIVSVAQHQQEKQHLLFVGTYRHNEIDDEHPLTNQLQNLQSNNSVNVTQINLPSLSRDDICDMIMTEMRLPRRLVCRLADIVHLKTSGHAIFVVELLNLFLRDSTIAYSPHRRRLDWDLCKVSSVKTGDNVASLIISKLASLQPTVFWTLCVISCFGFKLETSLLRLLQGSSLLPEGGFNLVSLVEGGFVELSGSVVTFTHDLIQQHVYEQMLVHQRQTLHLDIGTFLAAKTTLDSALAYQSIEAGVERLYVCDGGVEQDDDCSISILSLSGIATSQINKAGPEFISDRTQRIRFAGWNLRAANESAGKSNFRAALYYCKNGILFLGNNPWLDETCLLSVELHEGAAFALLALGNVKDVAEYANAIIDCENVEFEQSIVAQNMLIRSLETLGHYGPTIARGLAVLRRLNFDIPAAPSPVIVLQAMVQTSHIASQYKLLDNSPSLSSFTPRTKVIHPKQKSILKIIDSVAVACFVSTSSYLPLVACATVIYSLQQGIFHCEESASAFAIFGYFKVFLEGKFDEGQKWGNLAITILANSTNGNASVRARMYLFGFLYFWYISPSETCRRLHETYAIGMRCGDVDSAVYALFLDWKCQFFGGEKLSIVQANYVEYVKSITKYSKELSKHSVLYKINLNELIGISDEDPFSVLEGTICNEAELLEHAKLKEYIPLIEAVHLSQFLSAFWMGDFTKAMESSNDILMLPSSKMLKLQSIYFTFYRGIVAYRLFREGHGEHLLEEGNAVLSKLQSWRQTCGHVENKVLLLQAEYFTSKCNRNSAKEKYEAAIKSARDHGFLHERGLAYECMGKYFSSIVEISEAKQCFRQAHECYVQWGALGKAEQIWRDHGLDQNDRKFDQGITKHYREHDDVIGMA